jgi:uncharacterized protein
MNNRKLALITITLLVALFVANKFIPSMYLPNPLSKRTVTVSGTSKVAQANETAVYSVGVNAQNDDKESAINDVNSQIEIIINDLKGLGIEAADIKTQNISFYREEEYYFDSGSGNQRSRPGQWRANNNIEVRLRNLELMDDLTQLLARSGATNVYGPSFSVDDTKQSEAMLIEEAIADARTKAELYAQANGLRVGSVLRISEGSEYTPYFDRFAAEGMGGGGYIEPGTTQVFKSVTVTFELK